MLGGSGHIFGGALLGAAGVTILRDQLRDALPPPRRPYRKLPRTIVFGAILVLVLQTAARLWPLIARPPAPHASRRRRRRGAADARHARAARAAARARALMRRFRHLVMINDVGFELKSGEILALIGPNGAGKSTTFNLLTGAHAVSGGSIVFRGREYTDMTPALSAPQRRRPHLPSTSSSCPT